MKDFHKEYFLEILKKYRLGNATTEEISFLETYYDLFELNEDLINSENEDNYLDVKNAIKRAVQRDIDRYQNKPIRIGLRSLWVKYAVALSILFFLAVSGYFLLNRTKHYQATKTHVIVPGGNKAMLTLSNGTKIMLDDATKGEIAKQSGVSITKAADGQIIYKVISDKNDTTVSNSAESVQNTVSTPKGGQYQIILPDGTKVWLNAASSLNYPTVFHGTERLVTLIGEAYFEVTKNNQMPFRVKSGVQTIEVLGTHFNINAYADESTMKTTLLEGSVKVYSGTNSTLIAPGEQAIVNKTENGTFSKQHANLDKETAWKNGVFFFENDDLKSTMRQVARWYDVEIVYAENSCNEKFFGEISRNSKLKEVFKIFELNNVHFAIRGKTVTVSCNR